LAANDRHDSRCPFDRAFPLLNPLLARAAFVVEGNDIFGAHVGDDEADARGPGSAEGLMQGKVEQ